MREFKVNRSDASHGCRLCRSPGIGDVHALKTTFWLRAGLQVAKTKWVLVSAELRSSTPFYAIYLAGQLIN